MTASDPAAAVRPSVYPLRRRWFVLTCDLSGERYEFGALPDVEAVEGALQDGTLPNAFRFGMTAVLARSLAWGALQRPGEPACYGVSFTLLMEPA